MNFLFLGIFWNFLIFLQIYLNFFGFHLQLKRIKNHIKNYADMAAVVARHRHVAKYVHATWQRMYVYVHAHVCACLHMCARVCN